MNDDPLPSPEPRDHAIGVLGVTTQAVAQETLRDVRTNLNAVEQLALFWGGETGTKIRNHIGRIRELLIL